jgi:hypothetical protein
MNPMADDQATKRLEERLRTGFAIARLPIEPASLTAFVEQVTETAEPERTSRSGGGRFLLLVAAALALTAGLAILSGAGRLPAVTTTPSPVAVATTPIPSNAATAPPPSMASSPMPLPSAPYSNADLEAFITQVESQRDWFTSIGVELFDSDIDALTDTVRVRYIARDDTAGPAILAHFGFPDWLTPKWYGPPPWAGPRGRLVIRFVDSAGRPLAVTAGITCSPVAVDTSVGYESLPKDTQGTSRCVFDDVPAVVWDVEVRYTDRHDDNKTLHRKVTVPAEGTGVVTVEIRR